MRLPPLKKPPPLRPLLQRKPLLLQPPLPKRLLLQLPLLPKRPLLQLPPLLLKKQQRQPLLRLLLAEVFGGLEVVLREQQRQLRLPGLADLHLQRAAVDDLLVRGDQEEHEGVHVGGGGRRRLGAAPLPYASEG